MQNNWRLFSLVLLVILVQVAENILAHRQSEFRFRPPEFCHATAHLCIPTNSNMDRSTEVDESKMDCTVTISFDVLLQEQQSESQQRFYVSESMCIISGFALYLG